MHDLSSLIVAALAVWEVVEIWHHSALFIGARARAEVLDNKLGDLLGCPFCLSVWVALILTCLLSLAMWLLSTGGAILGTILWAPVFALAVARLANIGNDLTHRFCRTPQDDKIPPVEAFLSEVFDVENPNAMPWAKESEQPNKD
jgi:hypothetical protein